MVGHYQLRLTGLSDFPLDDNGYPQHQRFYGEQRLRLEPAMLLGKTVSIRVQADVLTGQIFGDTWPVASRWLDRPRDQRDGWRQAQLRQAYVEWQSPVGTWRAGQQSSHWGLGLLAHDGLVHEDWPAFGDPWRGDLVERLQWTGQPGTWFANNSLARRFWLTLALDVVNQDEQVDLLADDVVVQAVAALTYRSPGLDTGLYFAYRRRWLDRAPVAEGYAASVHASYRHEFSAAHLQLALQFEGVVQAGRDHRPTFPTSVGQAPLGFGAVLRTILSWPDFGLAAALESGFASGDDDPDDQRDHSFAFDSDYKIGLILFDEVLGRLSARSADRVAAHALPGAAVVGLSRLPSQGSVTNAFYLNPLVRWRPLASLDARLGFLWALAPAAWLDPYETQRAAGRATNAYGRRSSARNLGYEIDAGISYALSIAALLTCKLGLEGGVFFGGEAFDGPDGAPFDVVWLTRGRVDLDW